MRTYSLLSLAGLLQLGSANYFLADDYKASNFFDKFSFRSGPDPSNGYVTYVDQKDALSLGLASTAGGSVYLGADYKEVATGLGRKSVRIETKKTYKGGLIIADIEHMPAGACGLWPAFWSSGKNWPQDGEIDIIEGANQPRFNSFVAHTGPGCSIENSGKFTGTLQSTNCDINAAGQGSNQGCVIQSTDQRGYGTNFNDGKGGIYATEWTSNAISIWFFPRGQIPPNVQSANPDPSSWSKPAAQFAGGCNIDETFQEQRIIFNVAFCGWAGGIWNTDSVCSAKAPTCETYVQNNPAAFKEAYWSINSMKIFQKGTQRPLTPSSQPPAASSSIPVNEPTSINTPTTAPTVVPQPSSSDEPVNSIEPQPQPGPSTSSSSSSSSNLEAPLPSETEPGSVSASEHTESNTPSPTWHACKTFVTQKVIPIVTTVLVEAKPEGTGDAIVPIDDSLRRRREVARHAKHHG